MLSFKNAGCLPLCLLCFRAAAALAAPPVSPYVSYADLRHLPTTPEQQVWLPDLAAGVSSPHASGLRQLVNVPGLASSATPLAPSGDVGSGHYIQAINATGGASFAVFDKEGILAAGPATLATLGSGVCANGAGDPSVLFDERADRWVLAELSATANALCVYVSLTSDPISGGWCSYSFATQGALHYPKLGIWLNAYVLTGDESGDLPVYALDRANMITCGTARPIQRRSAARLSGFGFQAFTPADADGAIEPGLSAPALLVRHRDDEIHTPGTANPAQDAIELWELSVDWTTPASTTLTGPSDIPVSEFDSNLCPPLAARACIPQPATSVLLDPLVAVVMPRLQYRSFGAHETLVGVLQTDVGDFADHVGERWFELRNVGAGWVLYQDGNFSPDAAHRFLGTVAMDDDGNLLLAYDVSSASIHPSIRYTGRQAEDLLSAMTSAEATLAAGGGSNPSSRYGDHAQVGVDPEDGCTFWITAVYNPTASAATRIGAVRFIDCRLEGIFADGLESGSTNAWSGVVP